MPIKNTDLVYVPGTSIPVSIVVPEPPEWLFDADDPGVMVHGTAFANWTVDGGSSKSAAGITLVQGASDQAVYDVPGLSHATEYWMRIQVDAKTAGMNGQARIVALADTGAEIAGTDGALKNVGTAGALGTWYFKVKTGATSATPGFHRLVIKHATSPNGESFRMSRIDLWDSTDSSVPVVVLGDRTGGFNAARGTLVDDLIATLGVTKLVATGDLAGTGASEDYDDINDDIVAIMGGVGNILPNAGNHDYDHTPTAGDGYLTYFPHVAAASPAAGNLATYYTATVGNIEFFMVDVISNNTDNAGTANEAAQKADTMGVWLLAQLAASTAPWKVVMVHYPPRSSSAASTDHTNWAWNWGELGVPLILQGHKHSIELLDYSEERDGCCYYTNGRAGSDHHGWGTILPQTVWREEDTSVSGALKIHDGADRLTLEFWRTDGVLLNRFVIAKNPDFEP